MKFFSIFFIFLLTISDTIAYNGRYGWFTQKAPQKIIVCENKNLTISEQMLLESLSGLAAQAVNENIFNEMVWKHINKESYKQIFQSSIDSLNICTIKRMDVWKLLKYLHKKQIVKGYILYQKDTSKGELYSRRKGINYSSNVATVYASLLKGVLIDETLESKIKHLGLKLLKDARKETPEICFSQCKKHLNNHSALSIDPQVPNCRDIAIAQKLMLYYDTKALAEDVLKWVEPLSPILGWNCGNEDEYTGAITRWGHYNTASNWCHNLPLIMAASNKMTINPIEESTPSDSSLKNKLSLHSFVISDGDNMQWTMGDFIDNPAYYGNSENNKVPISWTLCSINLSIVSTSTWNRIATSKHKNSSIIEYGGGYQYPDLFAINRPNRKELLTRFARRINWHLKKLNIKIFGFICKDVYSKEALEAFNIYAKEIENLTGMIAIQYNPYNLGGDIIWIKNKKNEDIPILTARYSIWENLFDNNLCGAPDYIASLLNREANKAQANHKQKLDFTIVHAWSEFKQTVKTQSYPIRGYYACKMANDLLSPLVKNVTLNELLWHIRHRFKPKYNIPPYQQCQHEARNVPPPAHCSP